MCRYRYENSFALYLTSRVRVTFDRANLYTKKKVEYEDNHVATYIYQDKIRLLQPWDRLRATAIEATTTTLHPRLRRTPVPIPRQKRRRQTPFLR